MPYKRSDDCGLTGARSLTGTTTESDKHLLFRKLLEEARAESYRAEEALRQGRFDELERARNNAADYFDRARQMTFGACDAS